MQTIRIFISSPGDVAEERVKARHVIEQLQRHYGRRAVLQPVLWEDLPLGADVSFQHGIDIVLSEKMRIEIAVFILWSRLGSPPGPPLKADGTPYRSGTEREFDLMMQAREQGGEGRPHILAYTRKDDEAFNAALDAGRSDDSLEELIAQRKKARQFVEEHFQDESGRNVRAFHTYDKPLSFAARLKVHLRTVIDQLLGEEAPDRVVWEGVPYRGLQVFDVDHAPIYFGREQEVCDLEMLLRKRETDGCAFVAVVGASGSGKSSLVRAGLASSLIQDNLDTTVAAWRSAVLMPGASGGRLLEALLQTMAGALKELTAQGLTPAELAKECETNPAAVMRMAVQPAFGRAAEQAGGIVKVLLIIDQMEELWTDARNSPEQRERFLEMLELLARSGRMWVVATLRSDFYALAQASAAFLRLKGGDGHFDLVAPEPAAVLRIIQEPARLAGVSFEREQDSGHSLDQLLLRDALHQPDALPLLEFALERLYEARDEGKRMTFSAYEKMGGVEGALGRQAEDEFNSLPEAVRAAFSSVFKHLVTVESDSEGQATRRTAVLSALAASPACGQMVEALVSRRLLTTDSEDGAAVVRITHEALLRRWDRLSGWINANRDLLRLRSRVEQDCERWIAEQRNASLLLPAGLPMEEGRRLLRDGPDLLQPDCADYIRASITAQEQAEARRQRARRLVMTGMAALTTLALGGGALSFMQWQTASKERDARQAEYERAEQAGEAARSSVADLHRENAAREIEAGQWGNAAVHLGAAWMHDSHHAETDLLLPMALRHLEGCRESFMAHPGEVTALELSLDGKWLVSAGEHGDVKIWDTATKAAKQDFFNHRAAVRTLRLHQQQDGALLLATTGDDFRVNVHECLTGKTVYQSIDHVNRVNGLAFNKAGDALLSWSEDATLVIHELTAGAGRAAKIKCFSQGGVRAALWTDEDRRILAVHEGGRITIWDRAEKKLLSEHAPAGSGAVVQCAALDPQGKWLALGMLSAEVIFIDAETGTVAHTLRTSSAAPLDLRFVFQEAPWDASTGTLHLHVARADGRLERWQPHSATLQEGFDRSHPVMPSQASPTTVALSADGTMYAVADAAGGLRLHHGVSGRLLHHARAHEGGCTSLILSPDGLSAWSGGLRGEVRAWKLPYERVLAHPGGISSLEKDAKEQWLLTSGRDGMARLWDAATGSLVRELAHAPGKAIVHAARFDSSGTHCLTAGGAEVRVWNLSTPDAPPQIIRVEEPHWISDAQFTGKDDHVLLAVRTHQPAKDSSATPVVAGAGDGWRIVRISDGKVTSRRAYDLSHVIHVLALPDQPMVLAATSHYAVIDVAESGLNWATISKISAANWLGQPRALFGHSDGQVTLHSAFDGPIWESARTGSRVNTVGYDHDRQTVFSADEAGHLRLFDLASGVEKMDMTSGGAGWVSAVMMRSEGLLIAAARNGETAAWNPLTGRHLATWALHTRAVTGLQHVSAAGVCVTAGMDGMLRRVRTGWGQKEEVKDNSALLTRVLNAVAEKEWLPAIHDDKPAVAAALQTLKDATARAAETDSVIVKAFQQGRWEDAWQSYAQNTPATAEEQWIQAFLKTRRAGLRTRVPGHQAPVMSIAAGSQHVFSADRTGGVRRWNPATWKLESHFDSGHDVLWRCQPSPDDKWLVLIGPSSDHWLHEAVSGRQEYALNGRKRALMGCYDRIGSHFYGGSYDHVMHEWSVPEGKPSRSFELPKEIIATKPSLVELEGKDHLLVSSRQHVVVIRLEDGDTRIYPAADSGAASAVARYVEHVILTPDKTRLLLASSQGVEVIDRASGKIVQTLPLEGKTAYRLAPLESSKEIIASTRDGRLYALALDEEKITAKAWLTGSSSNTLVTSLPGKDLLLVESDEAGASLWSGKGLRKLADLRFDANPPGQLEQQSRSAVLADGATVVTSTLDHALYAWDVNEAVGAASACPALSFKPGIQPGAALSSFALWDDLTRSVRVMDANSGAPRVAISLDAEPVGQGLHLFPDGKRLLLVQNDKEGLGITLRSIAETDKITPTSLKNHISRLLPVPESDDVLVLEQGRGKSLHRLRPDGTLRWSWSLPSSSRLAQAVWMRNHAAPAQQIIAVADSAGKLIALHPDTAEVLWSIEDTGRGASFVAGIADPEGRHWITAAGNGIWRVWDLAEKQLVKTVHGMGNRPVSVSFSETSRIALVHGEDGSLERWDLTSLTCQQRLPADPARRVSTLSTDGAWVIAGDVRGEICIWTGDTEKPLLCRPMLPTGVDRLQLLSGNCLLITSNEGFATTWPLPYQSSPKPTSSQNP